MPILSAHKLTKEFADRVLIQSADFALEKGDIVGFIGANGVGKTTLFRMIIGGENPSGGEIIKASGIKIGYLEQHVSVSSEKSAYEETLSVFDNLISLEQKLESINQTLLKSSDTSLIEEQLRLTEIFQKQGGLTYQNRTYAVLTGLGFTPEQIRLPVSSLSGGQRSKLGLAKLLLCDNDLILLDEPTNHLDIDSIIWLEEFIKSFSGAAIIISHDRFFLDQVSTKTMELENKKIYFSNGNFSRYEELKKERLLAESREYENKVKEIHRIEGIIEQQRRWNREKNIKTAESKQKQIDRIEKTLVKPESETHQIYIDFPVANQSGSRVLTVENEQCRFSEKLLYKNVSFEILKGERVCLIGANGAGKTTLIKRILASEGENVSFGVGVKVGYFDQFQESISPKLTPFEQIHSAYPNMTDTAVRNALAAFEFKGDDVFKQNSALSGGEKAKLSICSLVLSGKNFLILDEPTNHLDLYSRKALEEALMAYKGTLLIISHDRYFINKIADKVIFLENNGTTVIKGNYDELLRVLDKRSGAILEEKTTIQKEQRGKEQYLLNKQRQSEIRKLETAVKRAEEEIARLEKEAEDLKASTLEAVTDFAKLSELTTLLEENEKSLEEQINLWEAKSEELFLLKQEN